jgi:PKD repeat protein
MFDGTGSYDPEGGSLLYDWDFGDLTSAAGAITSHTYDSPGTYTARLLVEDEFGNFDFDTIAITVSAVPVPAAVWLFGSGLLGVIGIARRKKS